VIGRKDVPASYHLAVVVDDALQGVTDVARGMDLFNATSLHRLLQPGARVVFLDNSEVQCIELPIAERDAEGNTYQHRRLKDGTLHRVLKNFPAQAELQSMIAGIGTAPEYRSLQNFWLFSYETTVPAPAPV
jgi:hypothetical protein